MITANNSLSQRSKKTDLIQYESNGETVNISPQFVRNYLVSGGGDVTDQEVMMFISLCRFQHLNPFLREAYLIKFSGQNPQPATIVVGKDVFFKRAKKHSDFGGLQSGLILEVSDTGEIVEREGGFYHREHEKILGAWAKVFVKGFTVPVYASVALDEYIGRKKNGEVNSMWSNKPATMILKVAESHALKNAYPEDLSGMYAQEEIAETSNIVLDETPIIQNEIPQVQTEAPEPFTEPKIESDVSSALFD